MPMMSAAEFAQVGHRLRLPQTLRVPVRDGRDCLHRPVHGDDLVGRQHAQPDLRVGVHRVQRRVVELLGDREVSDAHRHDALQSPDEQYDRHL